ncbi:hypothetical protein POM88_000882 [Heracleum sosnowskyi]|uniref:Clu domain-containing protein n=1 Tax=Heracleum sosnowskyi TaxID=360622 RepID=A0AAD8JF37_9APIA|nr:hypothetical protein POM88_000882 [Heracleum sosnowskyi]
MLLQVVLWGHQQMHSTYKSYRSGVLSYNNIFFSFAVDVDLEHLPRKQSPENNLKSEKTNPSPTLYETVDKISDEAIAVLAMAITIRGHRVVAQSVLPGILQGDKSDSLLYGSVDNGKKICWIEEFNSKHTVLDGSGAVFKLAAPVECKGIVGSDDRQRVLSIESIATLAEVDTVKL